MSPSSPRRARLLPPEGTTFFWNLQESRSGPGFYLHPLFTKYTPFCVFLLISFQNVVELYKLRNETCFPSETFAKLYGLRNDACFDFQNVVKLYGLRNNACFVGSEGSKQGSRTDHKYSRTKLGYDSCPSLLILYWR